ncbi:MAG: beta-galactosidase [Armatimonadetes bacterium]|nr:beta-galactosidase [Armatimonadota bacterium]
MLVGPVLGLLVGVSMQADVKDAPVAPRSLLSPLYFDTCRRPCEYVGFSFDDELSELLQMREHGANAVGSGSMWVPTDDPSAPYGAGIPSLVGLRDTTHLGQTFRATMPFAGVALCTPTFVTEGSGCTLSLYSSAPDEWGKVAPRPLAQAVFTNVRDNQLVWLTFEELPPGMYYVEQSDPTGPAIGAWARGRDVYAEGAAYVNRRPVADDLELWVRTADGDQALVAPAPDHYSIGLRHGAVGRIVAAGMYFDYAVGNWNNGGFPYYPDWFIERFPDIAMLDAGGRPIMAGMFGKLAPWPSIDQPVIVDGTRRYITAVVSALRDVPNLLYWCMGGEALYPTYGGGPWTDYAPDAVAHYRAWLRLRYKTIADLNEAWETNYTDFSEINPPKPPLPRDLPTLEWLRYRNVAMAERFQYHFDATKAADPSRLVVTCNHGDLFHGRWATEMGVDLNLYAGVGDGWEMGQIMQDDDPDLYNLMWMRSAGTFGKPLCPVRLAYKKTNPRARGGGTSYTPETARRYFWESVGTGAWHMGFIQWRGDLPDGEWGVKGTPAQEEIRRILTEWHAVEAHFDDAWPVREKVGLYFAQPTWTLDGFSPLWTELHREFTRRQIGYRILCDDQLLARDFTDCPVVICAENVVMSEDCVRVLRKYASAGGLLVLIGRNAVEDEMLKRRGRDAFANAGANVVRFAPDAATLFDDLERLIDDRGARYIRLEATTDRPLFARQVETITDGHDMPFDLAGHRSVGQTFLATRDGLGSVAVFNPTYTKTITDYSLTIEVLAGGRDGRVIARRTFPADELTDNARHEVTIDPPAPAGTYYVRLVTPQGLPPATLGVWGRGADVYPSGTRHVDDIPADGDLKVELGYRVPLPPRAAIEAFTLSDSVNAIVILTNITDVQVEARLRVAPDLLPQDVGRVRITDLATSAALGEAPRDDIEAAVSVPAHRSAVLLFEAEVAPAAVERALANLEASIAGLPADATRPHRAHLTRAREALAAGRYAKALASLRRAEDRIPARIEARLRDDDFLEISVVAFPPEVEAAPGHVTLTFVPIPGVRIQLGRERSAGVVCTYSDAFPFRALGFRYDYENRKYLRYFGTVEIVASAAFGHRDLAVSCVVNIPPDT